MTSHPDHPTNDPSVFTNAMAAALEAIRSGAATYAQASATWGIPQGTLKARIKRERAAQAKVPEPQRACNQGATAAQPAVIDLGTLHADPSNTRIHDQRNKAAIAASIERHGFLGAVVVEKGTGRILAGNERTQQALAAGMLEGVVVQYDPQRQVPVIMADLDGREADRFALTDNRTAELAVWDDDLLAKVLADMGEMGDLWTAAEVKAQVVGLAPPPVQEDDTVPLPVPAVPVSRQGEVYELGPHRLACGDCRAPGVVAQLLGGRKINLAFTSPPYASQRRYDESSGFKPIPPDQYVDWFEAVQGAVRENLAGDGSWFVNIKEHCEDGQRHLYVKDLTIAHVRRWGWRFVDELCWLRTGVPGHPAKMGGRFKNGFEPVFHFVGESHKMRPENVAHDTEKAVVYAEHGETRSKVGTDGTSKGSKGTSLPSAGLGRAFPSNVLDIKGMPDQEGHSAAFPVALPEFFVKAYTDPDDAVFDPFMGSGTTMIAAAKNGRIAYGTEISPGYCDVIRRRWTRWAKANNQDPGPGALE